MSYKPQLEKIIYTSRFESFLFDEEVHSFMCFYMNGCDAKKVKKEFIRFYGEVCDSYMSQMFKDYPESEYDYEQIPGGDISQIKINGEKIIVDFSNISLLVYGHGIPMFDDFGDYFVSQMDDKYVKGMFPSISYELFLTWEQDTGPEVDLFREIYSNDVNCSYEYTYKRLEKLLVEAGLSEIEESEEYDEYEQEDNEDIRQNEKVKLLENMMPFQRLCELFRINYESWDEYNKDEVYDSYSHLMYEMVFDGFPETMSYEGFLEYFSHFDPNTSDLKFDTDISEKEYMSAVEEVRSMIGSNQIE